MKILILVYLTISLAISLFCLAVVCHDILSERAEKRKARRKKENPTSEKNDGKA